MTPSIIRPMNRDALQEQYANAAPFPHFVIDEFLENAFAAEVAAAYPAYESARTLGREFTKVHERLKIQITEKALFPEPVRKLANALSSPEWLEQLQYITQIPTLIDDPELAGGGMHITGPGGRLDVHVDFNFVPERQLHRRLNILLYLNRVWEDSWGGAIELWDQDVSRCHQAFKPVFNRCLVFQTSEVSYHGVTPVTAPKGYTRQSFAAYYYTKEAPANWDGREHSTVFKNRPTEKMRRYVLSPADSARRTLQRATRNVKRYIKTLVD